MITSNVIPLPRGESRVRAEPVAVLDIGTSKMCCLIARQRGDRLELQGGGYQLAEGLRAGGIVDSEAAEASILAVVHEAEQQAGRTVHEIVLGLSGGRLESTIRVVDLDLGGRAVGPADISHALRLARAQARAEGLEVLHALPVEITLDDSQRLRDARGMVGHRLRIAVHLVRVASAALHNLLAAVERCHLDVAAVVAAPYAAGLACLSPDEATFGAVVLDLGAGVTGIARFADGRLHELASVPLGAQHVTQDLAFGLSTGRAQAERLKTLYGSVLARAGDARQHLEVPGLGDPLRPPVQIVSRARLTEIIRPRVEEILQLARARIDLDRLPVTGRRLVLSGGGSQLEGIVDLAEETFGMPARLGRARPFDAGAVQDLTAATTAVGLLRWTSEDDGGLTFGASSPNREFTARLARLGQWLRENF
ncbi:MAG TPA: cell division protein FtsA [Geminicoccaceae bacterium]